MHDDGGNELRANHDANPADSVLPESFLQESDQDFMQDESSSAGTWTDANLADQDSSDRRGTPARSASGSASASSSTAPRSGARVASQDLSAPFSADPMTGIGGRVEAVSPAASDVRQSSTAASSSPVSHTGSSVESQTRPADSPGSYATSVPVAPTVCEPSRVRTRLQHGIVQPNARIQHDGGDRVRYDQIRFANFCNTGEPDNVQEALADPKWKYAMDEVYSALMQNRTWHLVPASKGNNVIDCKWVYNVKRKADGSIDRYKARLEIGRAHV